MRKIYLLITSAMLLIGSGTMWAQDCNDDNAIADYLYQYKNSKNKKVEETGFICASTDLVSFLTTSITGASKFTGYDFNNAEINIRSGNAITIPQIPAIIESTAINGEKSLVKVTPAYVGGLFQPYSGENITCTNNFGATVNGEWQGGIYIEGSMTESTFINNANIIFADGTNFEGLSIENNEGGLVVFENGINGTCSASIANSGTVIFSGGIFYTKITITGTGEVKATGGKFRKTAYSLDDVKALVETGYKVRENSDNYEVVGDVVVAKVGDKDYYNVWNAFLASSTENPAVLQMDATIKFNIIAGRGTARTDNFILDLNGHNLTATGSISFLYNDHYSTSLSFINSQDEGGVINASNPSVVDEEGISILFSLTSASDYYAKLTIGAGVTINCASDIDYGVALMPNSNAADAASVNIAGNLSMESGTALYIHGLVKKVGEYTPVFNIAEGASITSSCSNACIYAAGYGIWNIGAATLNAGTPIYAKSGTVNINGATIAACGEYAEPQPYGNGFYGTGDAIVFDSKNGYAGNMQLIVNDATITSANGYAVQEVLTDRQESQTLSMTINGGKFKGEKGTIVVSENFNVSTPTRWANNSIMSGKYTSAPNDVADGYVVALNTDDDKAEYPYVVVADNTYPGIVTEITTNTTETSVVEIAENHGILVKSGVTYDVKGISFTGAKTRITVEPGATLIVGESGFIGSDADRMLVLEADKANGTAKLKFNGTTEAASHVYAKVEQYMYAKALGSDTYVWQHIGSPMQTDQLNKISKTDPYLFNAWNVSGSWKYVGPSEVTSAWVGYNSTTNRTTEGSKLTYEGSLEGNSPAQFTFEPNGYNCFANSYVSALSIKETLGALSTSGVQTDGMIWIYDAALGKKWIQRNVEYYTIFGNDDEGIAPMQAFFLLNNSSNASSFTVSDYKTAVYDFNGETPVLKGAPDVNAGIITLTSGDESATLQIIEGDQYSDEFGPGDGYQMATDMVQIYVLQGESKLSAIATNSLKDKEIVIVTKANTSCTLSFSNLIGNAFKLTDIVTGVEVEVGADKTYTFTAEANSTIKRFKLGEGEVSAEEADANNVNVWVANNSMNIAGAAEGDAIEIINLAGVTVLSATATGEAVQTISLGGIASGAYIVKAGAATVKVIK